MWAPASSMEENSSKMQQFISITGAPVEIATNLLEACNGDVNLAVSMHLDNGGGVGVGPLEEPGKTSTVNHSASSSGQTYEERHGVRAPIPQQQGVLIEEQVLPRRTFRRRNLPKSVFDPFQDYSNTNRPSYPTLSGASYINPVPIDDKKKTLADLFRPPIELMFKGDFAEARMAGQASGKWLLVNLQDSTEFSCQVLNRDLWSNTRVKRIINDNFVFWQIQKITDEGIRFGNLYNIETYPAIVIIDPRTGRVSVRGVSPIGEKMEQWSHLSVQEFISKVSEFNSINKLCEDQHQDNEVSVICEEDQLEAAIKASLADSQEDHIIINSDSDIDGCGLLSPQIISDDSDDNMDDSSMTSDGLRYNRKRPATRQLSKHVQGRTKRSKTRKVEEVTNQKSDLSDDFEDVRIKDDNTDELMYDRSSNIDNNGGNVQTISTAGVHGAAGEQCQILIRLPDGRRLVKSYCTRAPIQELFNCLKNEGFPLPEYEVMLTFPRTILSTLSLSTTFNEAGLCPRQTIYVQMAD